MTKAKFIEELQKVLVEAICENQGKSVVFDFRDKDDDDDEVQELKVKGINC